MNYLGVVVVSALLSSSSAEKYQQFPPWFKFGAASSAYQVEGAWNVSDKGESIWDRLLHDGSKEALDGSNGDVACDSYHLWRRDIEMANELGLDMYRFSISWSRLLPTGFSNIISEDGKNYYNNLIDGLLEKGIEPMVTIYHFDLPQSLEDLGGWTNPLISTWFEDYSKAVFSLFADRVKLWITINEPLVCDTAYNLQAAPYYDDPQLAMYLCNKNILMAHAKAYRVYDEVYKPKYHGKVSITQIFFWFEPLTPDDDEITELAFDAWIGRYGHPIYSKEGGWPPKLEKILNENARREGYSHPRMPPFTLEEIELVRGTYDYFALNYYTARLVRKARPGEKIGPWPFYGSTETDMVMESDPSWKTLTPDWFAIYPEGLRKQLHWLNQTYGDIEIIITENGLPTTTDTLFDTDRMEFIRDHLEQVFLAINDGIRVTGYTVWTLMDNFEWLGGYQFKYGLYTVNFTNPNRTRVPRESARFYRDVIRRRTLHLDNDIL